MSQGNLLEQVIEQVKYEQNKTYVKVIFNTENFAIPNLGGGAHWSKREETTQPAAYVYNDNIFSSFLKIANSEKNIL